MIIPGRNVDIPSPIFNHPNLCQHPREKITFTGHFPEDHPEQSVFKAHCYECGSHWDQTDDDAPWAVLSAKIAHGEFGVVSRSDLEIEHKVEWKRQTRYDSILKDVSGTGNPISDSDVPLRRPTLD